METKLLQHQRVGIEWMTLREHFDADDIKFKNIISEEIEGLPEVVCGGILPDDMGLGKTLQYISVITGGGAGGRRADANRGAADVIGNWLTRFASRCTTGLVFIKKIIEISNNRVSYRQSEDLQDA